MLLLDIHGFSKSKQKLTIKLKTYRYTKGKDMDFSSEELNSEI